MPPELIDVKTLHEGWGRLLALRIRLPGGEVIKREVEDHGAAVCVLPYDPERRGAAPAARPWKRSASRSRCWSRSARSGPCRASRPNACISFSPRMDPATGPER